MRVPMATDDELRAKVPKYHQLLFPVVKALKALSGSGTNEEIFDKVCELENIPDDVQRVASKFAQAQTSLLYRLAWARTYLKFVGALANNERGVWALTEIGA